MVKKIIIAVVIIAVAAIILFLLFKKPQMPPGTIFFYGDGCSHCKNVEDYMIANKVEEKVTFGKKEVFNNQDNAKLLGKAAKFCGLPTDKVGVPFLWDGQNQKCLMGEVDIINFFSEKIK
jgi:hypothetical protein